MAFNLIDSFKSLITPEIVDKAALQFGESQAGISKAVSGAVPAILAGFIHMAETGHADSLLQDAKEAASNNLSNFSDTGSVLSKGIEWVNNLFGTRLSSIEDVLARFAGIKSASANSLLGMLAPVGLGVIGKHALDSNLSASGLTSFLSSQKASVLGALPDGLNLGIDRWLGSTERVHENVTTATATARRAMASAAPPRTNWVLPLILILGAVGLLWYFLGRSDNKEKEVAATPVTDTVSEAPMTPAESAAAAVERESMKVRLADNTEINAYKGGIEDRLVTCLNDATCMAGKDQWFDFDNINFETGSAQLTAQSQAQISNIVMIMNAYPKAKIKIGGYTDKTGDDAANKKLSQDRAETVLNALKAGGVQQSQLIGAEGYGSEFAKVPASAPDEERRVDRRISVQLREK
ncbi:OmpA family protein [Chitinophagaceae bacterium LB-8]|uniref:OmpA family protein n=1 Tax=Paraflavisolibacter caeni TaxID=2982496 RepID=A0A9X2XZC5_9BACT|nr:DUF937 domain-containing protein [Paraflavisolibacter caeni]MCU7552364.1 OmpA family protein [Paraflavisolibacter caeni]